MLEIALCFVVALLAIDIVLLIQRRDLKKSLAGLRASWQDLNQQYDTLEGTYVRTKKLNGELVDQVNSHNERPRDLRDAVMMAYKDDPTMRKYMLAIVDSDLAKAKKKKAHKRRKQPTPTKHRR